MIALNKKSQAIIEVIIIHLEGLNEYILWLSTQKDLDISQWKTKIATLWRRTVMSVQSSRHPECLRNVTVIYLAAVEIFQGG